MSHAGLGLREEPRYKCTLAHGILVHEPSPLHTWRLKSQQYENSSSTSTPELSVSCTRTLCELHPPPPALLALSCPWPLASLFLGVVWLYSLLSPHLLRCLAWHLHGRQHLSFLNGSVAVSGYRRSSGPGGSAPWYCIISMVHCSVLSASSKGRDLVSVLLPSYFYLIGHILLLPDLVFVPWLCYSQQPPTPLSCFSVWPPSTSFL